MSGISPFTGNSIEEIIKCNKQGDIDYPIEFWKGVSNEALDLVMKMTEFDQYKRPLAKECLSHPWFSIAKHSRKPLKSVPHNLIKFGIENGGWKEESPIYKQDDSETPLMLKRAMSNARARATLNDIEDCDLLSDNKDIRNMKQKRTSVLARTALRKMHKAVATTSTFMNQYNPFMCKIDLEEFNDTEIQKTQEESDIPDERPNFGKDPNVKILERNI